MTNLKISQVILRQWIDKNDHSKGRMPFFNPSTFTYLPNVIMMPRNYSIWQDRGEIQINASIFASPMVLQKFPNGSLVKYQLSATKTSGIVTIGLLEGNQKPAIQEGDIRDDLYGIRLRLSDPVWLNDISFSQEGLTSMLSIVESSTKTDQEGNLLNPIPKLIWEWSDELWYFNHSTGELSQNFEQWL